MSEERAAAAIEALGRGLLCSGNNYGLVSVMAICCGASDDRTEPFTYRHDLPHGRPLFEHLQKSMWTPRLHFIADLIGELSLSRKQYELGVTSGLAIEHV